MVLAACASRFLVTNVEQPCSKSAPVADEITSATTLLSTVAKGMEGQEVAEDGAVEQVYDAGTSHV